MITVRRIRYKMGRSSVKWTVGEREAIDRIAKRFGKIGSFVYHNISESLGMRIHMAVLRMLERTYE